MTVRVKTCAMSVDERYYGRNDADDGDVRQVERWQSAVEMECLVADMSKHLEAKVAGPRKHAVPSF